MEAGRFGKFGHVPDLKKKLEAFSYLHEDISSGDSLRSAVQVNKEGRLEDVPTIEGLVIDEVFQRIARLVQGSENKFEVETTHEKVALWTKFTIVGNGFVILENSSMAATAFRILSQAMSGTNNFVRPVGFNLQRIYRDYHGHWMDDIEDRPGHWRSGTLYGEGLETDDVVGSELARSKKKRVGFYTQFFEGDQKKVSVTRDGSVVVWGSVAREDFYQFALSELQTYMIT